MFKQFLKPNCIVSSFEELTFDRIPQRCFVAFIDLDNTLIHKTTHQINSQGIDWIQTFTTKHQGKVILISNNKHQDFETLATELKVPLIQLAFKPISIHYRKMLKKYDWKPSQVMVIGDQLLTDILGGKFHGFYTIYHKPLTSKDVGYNGLIRRLEKKWIKDYESTM
jgi:uncharacterized protein